MRMQGQHLQQCEMPSPRRKPRLPALKPSRNVNAARAQNGANLHRCLRMSRQLRSIHGHYGTRPSGPGIAESLHFVNDGAWSAISSEARHPVESSTRPEGGDCSEQSRLWVIRVGSVWSAFAGIADMNS